MLVFLVAFIGHYALLQKYVLSCLCSCMCLRLCCENETSSTTSVSLLVHLIQEHKRRLEHVTDIQAHLRNHLANLPDLNELPSFTDGLAPLPSAHDLFS